MRTRLDNKASILKEALRRLARLYGRPRRKRYGRGVDMLVETILSQNTNAANSTAGFEGLKKEFPRWEQAAEAAVGRIERCIRVSGLSRTKAPRIRRILRQIREDRGRIDLQFLARRPVEEAYEYLMSFAGVGPKTALCTLMFAFAMPVFPVDTHIQRIAIRLGVLSPKVPFARAHEALTPLILPGDRNALHLLLIAHGRRTCKARRPLCDRCVLLSLCGDGRRRMKIKSLPGIAARRTAEGN